MEIIKIYSPIDDPDIKRNLGTSSIWKEAYHKEDMPTDKAMICYHIKFNGLTPIQVTKIEKI